MKFQKKKKIIHTSHIVTHHTHTHTNTIIQQQQNN